MKIRQCRSLLTNLIAIETIPAASNPILSSDCMFPHFFWCCLMLQQRRDVRNGSDRCWNILIPRGAGAGSPE